jgi:hypothetical protein
MAGDWIKMRSDLFTHPKVVRIASALKADKLRTVGGLMSVWCLFDAHSADGTLDGYSGETLDDHLSWPGFSAAMSAVGWLSIGPESLALPEFETHNGASAKRRAQDADRKKAVRKTSASDADKMRTREEKIREEKKEQEQEAPPAPRPSVPRAPDPEPTPKQRLQAAGVEPAHIRDFLEIRKAKKAPLTDTAIDGIEREAAKAGITLAAAIKICCERSWQGFKADWLHDRGSAPAQPAQPPRTRQML